MTIKEAERKNEIKKLIYKNSCNAFLRYIRKGVAYYDILAPISDTKIRFEVPVSDMGTADFLPMMDAKLLIRYLAEQEEPVKTETDE